MGTAVALRVRTTTVAAPTRPTQHADALLKFDFRGQEVQKSGAKSGEPDSDAAETKVSIKEAIIHWLEQQL